MYHFVKTGKNCYIYFLKGVKNLNFSAIKVLFNWISIGHITDAIVLICTKQHFVIINSFNMPQFPWKLTFDWSYV